MLYENELYLEDVNLVADASLPWELLEGKTVVLSGATGLLGSFLVDVLLTKNLQGLNCHVYALGRNESKAKGRLSKWWDNDHFRFCRCDVNSPIILDGLDNVDYVFHLASNTHPIQYATDPIGTITTNIIGLQNMLDFAVSHGAARFAFASSNEVYGENRGDVDLFEESYCGYIDSNTLRAGYPESKRCGEALCQAYRVQKKLDIVVPRFTRSYGPTLLSTDTKAISQFIFKGVNKNDIVLKSKGTQLYSFTYVADAISGFLTVVLKGIDGEAYNISDMNSNITLLELAKTIADISGTNVVFDIPDSVESSGYSKATKALLDNKKLVSLGWSPCYDIRRGVQRTIEIMRSAL